ARPERDEGRDERRGVVDEAAAYQVVGEVRKVCEDLPAAGQVGPSSRRIDDWYAWVSPAQVRSRIGEGPRVRGRVDVSPRSEVRCDPLHPEQSDEGDLGGDGDARPRGDPPDAGHDGDRSGCHDRRVVARLDDRWDIRVERRGSEGEEEERNDRE